MRAAAMILAAAAVAAAGTVTAQESKFELKPGAGRDRAMQCGACHSLDYIPMNSRFLDKAGWTAEVNKMINVMKAPIARSDVDTIASYLAENYGKK